jgi:hypothetical protein
VSGGYAMPRLVLTVLAAVAEKVKGLRAAGET